jgi:hypothetical protein
VSAADSQWPAWLRRHAGVELLGPPRLFFAWLTIALSLLMIVYVGAWNAAKYPIVLGYDARPNIEYAHFLLDKHRLPTPAESGESNQPPAYYFIAGVASRAGHEIFGWLEARPFTAQLPEASYRGAQILNVVLVFLTALCVLWLARVVAPDRPWVWAASVGFFAFLPVVSKTEAMFHPENLNMFTAAVAVASGTTILVRRRLSRSLVLCLVGSLALGLATRASALFVVLTIALAAAITLGGSALHWSKTARRLTIGLVIIAIAGSIVGGLGVIRHHRADPEASDANFFSLSVSEVFSQPWRSSFKNQALPETYTDIWGDWFSGFSWSSYNGTPSPATQRILKDQSIIGVAPTLLAIAGWLGLCWAAARRRRDLLILALLPLVATTGYLVRSWLALTKDGDLFKATYLLNVAPVWALCFGLAIAWIAARSRLARYSMVVVFAIFAVLELRLTMYGIRDGAPIF